MLSVTIINKVLSGGSLANITMCDIERKHAFGCNETSCVAFKIDSRTMFVVERT
jgi:hypothetical protein